MAKPTTAPPAPGATAPPVPATGTGAPTTPATSPSASTTAPAVPPTTPDTNPIKMQVFRSFHSSDSTAVFARVLGKRDLSAKKAMVEFMWQGSSQSVATTKSGLVACPFNSNAIPLLEHDDDKDDRLVVTVSGIEHPAIINLRKRRKKTDVQKAKDRLNNVVAIWAIRILLFLWTVFAIGAFKYGSGEPLWQLRRTELTEQQRLVNSIPGPANDPLMIKPEEPAPFKEQWQKPCFLILSILTIATVIYGFFSLREEALEAARKCAQGIIDRRGYMESVSDPISERILSWLEMVKVVRASEPMTPTPTTPTNAGEIPVSAQTTPITGSSPFWNRFKASFLADFSVDVLPRIIRKLFM